MYKRFLIDVTNTARPMLVGDDTYNFGIAWLGLVAGVLRFHTGDIQTDQCTSMCGDTQFNAFLPGGSSVHGYCLIILCVHVWLFELIPR